MWLSFSVRYLVNVEDLNNVESAGNYVRHRRAPIVTKSDTGYILTYAPAISGEMIAHGYQSNLVLTSKQMNLPVDSLAEMGIFVKRGAKDDVHNTKCKEVKEEHDYEKCVIGEDVIEDVAGFMNPDKLVKRVSNIAFSYMIPALDAVKSSAVNPEFHVRYATNELMKANENAQSIYNVEVASSPYILTGYLNVDGIGCTQSTPLECVEKRNERISASLEALTLTLSQMLFGAKQTRFKPIVDIEALFISLTEKPFNLPPVSMSNNSMDSYIDFVSSTLESFKKALDLKNTNKIYYYVKEGLTTKNNDINNPVEVFNRVKNDLFPKK
ncbi:type I-A CRISPR-associated protein Cas7/Csa2 [Acidianus manzaensis]|uniref:Type I-A CRISPR-associated protein Cas7/Csa2 n=1 Tax=Acidianus manzaensis TaxID=282676 RepID=A0A1W6JWD1_9CREN|nr:type I-A CRISPR-associated protein Cas7/Csa2 [Acidianus manzaensis]ARM74581.1 type I-A CRISPR-associated protein Cas7/Csa2 [Acidianus manzaensis]